MVMSLSGLEQTLHQATSLTDAALERHSAELEEIYESATDKEKGVIGRQVLESARLLAYVRFEQSQRQPAEVSDADLTALLDQEPADTVTDQVLTAAETRVV